MACNKMNNTTDFVLGNRVCSPRVAFVPAHSLIAQGSYAGNV